MYKIIVFCILFLFSNISYGSENFEHEIKENFFNHKEIYQDLNFNLGSEEIEVVKLNVGGACNYGVYTIQIPHGEMNYKFIGKIIDSSKEKELSNYERLKGAVRTFNSLPNDYPKFPEFKGGFKLYNNNIVLVFTLAQGRELREFFTDDYVNELNGSQEHFNIIAKTLGNFYQHDNSDLISFINEKGKPDICIKGWTHGDIVTHIKNVFYNPKTTITTFIDYDGLKYDEQSDREIRDLFNVINEEITTRLIHKTGKFESYREPYSQEKVLSFIKGFIESFVNSFKDENLKTIVGYRALSQIKTENLLENDRSFLDKLKEEFNIKYSTLLSSENFMKSLRQGKSLKNDFQIFLENIPEGFEGIGRIYDTHIFSALKGETQDLDFMRGELESLINKSKMNKDEIKLVEYFLMRGISPNFVCENGASPLHKAVQRNNLELVEILLKNGADTNVKNKSITPLYIADKLNRYDIVSLLKKYGAEN